MSTKNRDIHHNFNWHARPAHEAVEVIEGVEYIYNPWVVERPFVYDAYGRHPWSPDEPSAADVFGDGFHQLFQGMQHDPEAGLIDFRTRDYSPTDPRFMQQEPLAYVDGLNTHVFENDESGKPINPLDE